MDTHAPTNPYKAGFADIVVCPLFVLLWMWAFTFDVGSPMSESAIASPVVDVAGSP